MLLKAGYMGMKEKHKGIRHGEGAREEDEGKRSKGEERRSVPQLRGPWRGREGRRRFMKGCERYQ